MGLQEGIEGQRISEESELIQQSQLVLDWLEDKKVKVDERLTVEHLAGMVEWVGVYESDLSIRLKGHELREVDEINPVIRFMSHEGKVYMQYRVGHWINRHEPKEGTELNSNSVHLQSGAVLSDVCRIGWGFNNFVSGGGELHVLSRSSRVVLCEDGSFYTGPRNDFRTKRWSPFLDILLSPRH